MVFIFTGSTGGHYVYVDETDENSVLYFTGERQVGDMRFIRCNVAIRDPTVTDKSLHLFRSLRKIKGYAYSGEFVYDSNYFTDGLDGNNEKRQAVVFHLETLYSFNKSVGELDSLEEVVQFAERSSS